jgi:hypothetical protein
MEDMTLSLLLLLAMPWRSQQTGMGDAKKYAKMSSASRAHLASDDLAEAN